MARSAPMPNIVKHEASSSDHSCEMTSPANGRLNVRSAGSVTSFFGSPTAQTRLWAGKVTSASPVNESLAPSGTVRAATGVAAGTAGDRTAGDGTAGDGAAPGTSAFTRLARLGALAARMAWVTRAA